MTRVLYNRMQLSYLLGTSFWRSSSILFLSSNSMSILLLLSSSILRFSSYSRSICFCFNSSSFCLNSSSFSFSSAFILNLFSSISTADNLDALLDFVLITACKIAYYYDGLYNIKHKHNNYTYKCMRVHYDNSHNSSSLSQSSSALLSWAIRLFLSINYY